MKTMKETWYSITGKPAEFSMEHRAMHVVVLMSLLMLLIATIGNLSMSLYTPGLITFISSVLLLVIYYFSRFKKIYYTTVVIYSLYSYFPIVVSFFFNSGTDGPVFYFFFATFILLLVVAPKNQQALWFSIHVVIGAALYFIEYRFPQLVPHTYSSRHLQYIDLYLCFVLILAFTWLLISHLRKYYNDEKQLANQRAQELEISNNTIHKQNLQLQAVNDEKDQLFSIISHDLRSPISSMKGLLQIMNDESVTADEKQQIENDLLKLSNNTFVLLENLLHWSSQKVKGYAHQISAMSLHDPIQESIELLEPSARAKSLQVDVSGSPEIKVLGNPEMLSIVIRNLLSNAIKFTPENGQVRIECTRNGKYAHLIVRDSGIGIPEEKQKSLFQSRQSSSYGTQNEAGAGLGLVLCQEYVSRMNGEIDFKSREKVGTEFRVKLPLAQ